MLTLMKRLNMSREGGDMGGLGQMMIVSDFETRAARPTGRGGEEVYLH